MVKSAVPILLLVAFGVATVSCGGVLPPVNPAGDSSAKAKCTSATAEIPDKWIAFHNTCEDSVRRQIQMEVDASYIYMAMAAHFSRDDINLPGFAKMFFGHASEEREHAEGLIDYLLMRGKTISSNLLAVQYPPKVEITSAVHALELALVKEKEVTESIKSVIKSCDDADNDYHLNDHLTGEYLDEQYKGMRELAGKVSTLKKMIKDSGALGTFLFDKTLL